MLHNKLFRHSIAFGSIAVASILLYPAAQGEENFFSWVLLAIILIAAALTIIK